MMAMNTTVGAGAQPFIYLTAADVPSEALRRALKAHYGEEHGRTADANRAFDEFEAGWLAALKFEREAGQRERLTQQLHGRDRAPVNTADYGAPALDET